MLPKCQQPAPPPGTVWSASTSHVPVPKPTLPRGCSPQAGAPRDRSRRGMAASTDKGGVCWSWCCKKRCRDQTGGGLQRWQNCTVIPLCHQSATSAATREPKQQSRCSICYLSSTAPSPLRVLSCVSTLRWAGAGCQGSV